MWVAFEIAKATHIFFSKNISVLAIFNDQSFNDTVTNDIVSFEQLGPGVLKDDSKQKHSYKNWKLKMLAYIKILNQTRFPNLQNSSFK